MATRPVRAAEVAFAPSGDRNLGAAQFGGLFLALLVADIDYVPDLET